MLEIQDGLATLMIDVEATRRLYALRSADENCKCDGCVWFAAHRGDAYPGTFRDLLNTLGIDVTLPNEVVTFGEPPDFVTGAFDFVGSFRQEERPDPEPWLSPLVGAFRYSFGNGWGIPRQRDWPVGFSPISHIAFEWLPGAA